MTLRHIAPLLVMLALAGCKRPPSSPPDQLPPMQWEVRLKTTPVKHQGNSPLCWAYAMLATIETDRLEMGDSVELSPAFLARAALFESARRQYLQPSAGAATMRGMGSGALRLIEQYGLAPYSWAEQRRHINWQRAARTVHRAARTAGSRGEGFTRLEARVEQAVSEATGYNPPPQFHLYAAEYTPHELAHSMMRPGGYEALTSFAHHPFYKPFVLETPDNIYQDAYLNLPIDTLMARIDGALKSHHAVCWEGDTSEPEFRHAIDGYRVDARRGWATASQAQRQDAFERRKTTDDHAMELMGVIRMDGRRYYVAKNSWGKASGLRGYMLLEEGYVRMKTVAVFMKTMKKERGGREE